MKLKLHRIVAGWFGYHLLRESKVADVLPEEHLRELLANLRITHVLDVGANIGQYAQALRRSGFSGRISSFEPVRSNFEQLHRLSEPDPQWDVYHLALGAQRGELEINVTGSTTFSSFLTPTEYARRRFDPAAVDVAHTEQVRVERLDVFASEMRIDANPRLFLKMDTQGFDLEVFRGADGLLDRIRGLQSELSILPVYQDMPDYLTALAAYREKGFEPTGLFPITRDPEKLVVIEYDCFMRNLRSL